MPDAPRPGADATFDVVVIGAGPAGCAAAVTLANDGRSVLVIDRRTPNLATRTDRDASPDQRPFLVGEGAPPGLDRAVDQVFGEGTFVRTDHLVSFGNRSAWGSDEPTGTDFMFNPFGPGWHLDRWAFDERLRARARDAGATLWTGTVRWDEARRTADAIEHDDGGRWHHERRWTLLVETESGSREVDTSLVCDASGRSAAFARRHGGNRTLHDRLVAAVAVYRAGAANGRTRPSGETGAAVVADDLDSTTTIEAVRAGWWYTAAIPHGRRVVAFFTDRDLCPDEVRSVDGFERLLDGTALVGLPVRGAAIGYELRSPPLVTAAGSAWFERPSGPGWLAAGDAAACFDPLSSQGLLTAVLMGRTAGDAALSLLVDADAGTEAFDSRYRAVIDRFVRDQRTMYGLERRWPDAPFWSRRLAAPEPDPEPG